MNDYKDTVSFDIDEYERRHDLPDSDTGYDTSDAEYQYCVETVRDTIDPIRLATLRSTRCSSWRESTNRMNSIERSAPRKWLTTQSHVASASRPSLDSEFA